jgi:uncharacterized membrane protein
VSRLRIADGLALPADAVTQTFGILAKRGMGKTYTAAVLVEELLKAGSRVVVADPIGVWYGLRAAANGRDPGLPIVVMGGDHGDLPLPVDAGKAVADFVVDSDQSVVLDLSLFRKGEQVRFMTDFAETLYHRNRAPLHLVLDEADAFAPQRPQKGEERMLGAIEDLVRRGRARGIGVTLVTQRAAVLNKNVLTQVEVLVALRTIAPQDREAMDAWIQAHGTPDDRKEFMGSLASLAVGEAWFWSPGWLDVFKRVQVRRRETFDSSATPRAGEAKRAPKKLADVDLAQLKETFSASIEKAKADDPRELRKRIAALERELATVKKAEPKVERVEIPVISEDDRRRLDDFAGLIRDLTQRYQTQIVPATTRRDPTPGTRPVEDGPRPRASKRISPGRAASTVVSRAPVNGSLPAGERKVLTAIAQHPGGVTRKQLTVLTGYKRSTRDLYLQKLKASGLIHGGDVLQVTEASAHALGDGFEPLPIGRELFEYWIGRLPEGERRVLQAIDDAGGTGATRDEISEVTGYKRSTRDLYLQKLRARQLIDHATGGYLVLSEALA